MTESNQLKSIRELIEIMALLRSPKGCQWDRQQTPESLKKHILEETYELLEAIDTGNTIDIRDELGDLLLQVVFQAQIFSESGDFSMQDVAQSISNKLKRRHPHIFSDAAQEGHEQRWEEIKQQERSKRGQSNRLEQRIPKTLPALKRAAKVAGRYPKSNQTDQIHQLQSQLQDIKNTLAKDNLSQVELEQQIGKLLFDICKLSATVGCEAEDCLRKITTHIISEIDSENNVY